MENEEKHNQINFCHVNNKHSNGKRCTSKHSGNRDRVKCEVRGRNKEGQGLVDILIHINLFTFLVRCKHALS